MKYKFKEDQETEWHECEVDNFMPFYYDWYYNRVNYSAATPRQFILDVKNESEEIAYIFTDNYRAYIMNNQPIVIQDLNFLVMEKESVDF